MKKRLILYKPVGETPLATIRRFQYQHPEYEKIKLGFAGRLDPVAEGLLLVLVGEENKQRHKYDALDKTYEVTILFGIKTDSFDLLGLPSLIQGRLRKEQEIFAKEFLLSRIGITQQTYPPYSSKTVAGKPLYYYARRGLLTTIQLPTHSVTISALTIEKNISLTSKDLLSYIEKRIAHVAGNFRQVRILTSWQKLLHQKLLTFSTVSLTASCSSGTYMRALADDTGRAIGSGALALSIKRTAIGKYIYHDIEGTSPHPPH